MTPATFDVEIDSELGAALASSYKALEGLSKANKALHGLLSIELASVAVALKAKSAATQKKIK